MNRISRRIGHHRYIVSPVPLLSSGSIYCSSQLSILRCGNSMPPKLLDRRESFSSSTSSSSKGFRSRSKKGEESLGTDFSYYGKGRDVTVWKDGSKVVLQTKPCFTCGREITPRSKWITSWDTLKYCSVKCRGWKSVVNIGEASELQEYVNEKGLFEKCLIVQKDNLLLNLDAWIEGTMMNLINSSDPEYQSMIFLHGGIPLQEVSTLMHEDLKRHRQIDSTVKETSIIPRYISKINDEVLIHNPGEREKIRRAARRLVVFPLEKSSFAQLFGTDTNELTPIALSQNHGRNRLETLKDVSYARQEIYIRRKV